MLQLQSQGKEFSGMMLDKGQTEADEVTPYNNIDMERENGSNITRGQLGHYHPFKLDLAGWRSKTIQH